MLSKCRMLLASWRIRHEEGVGASGSILDHVADDDGHLPPQRIESNLEQNIVHTGDDSDICRNGRQPTDRGIVYVSSQHSATHIMSGLIQQLRDYSGTEFPVSTLAWEKGIGVGPKIRRHIHINRSTHQYIHKYWQSVFGDHLGPDEVPLRVTYLKSTMVKATLYRPGDCAFVMSDSNDRRERSWYWKTRISRVFAHSCRGHTQIFFEGKWLFNSTTRSGGQEMRSFDPISNMEILDRHERVAIGDNCRHVHMLLCHFFPIHQKKAGDNHILAIPMGPYSSHSTMFVEGGIGHPPPQPEVDDVMLAVHRPNCPVKFPEYCVITQVQEAAGGPTFAEVEGVEDVVTVRSETNTTVHVRWLRRTVPLQWELSNRRCCTSLPVSHLRQRAEGFTQTAARTWNLIPS
ncbi:hypothetical protein R1sor_006138 [Riccia sorocarpa]|uniref:Uncharacterized protein n=1 Tax=Riccia sorocarpa TaxID=122646 RepID=A0ABD3HQ27_9MARC